MEIRKFCDAICEFCEGIDAQGLTATFRTDDYSATISLIRKKGKKD